MTGIILLAAGASRRLGQPKQLLPWGESNLLRHSVNVALQANLGPVVIVLGAVDCRESLKDQPIKMVTNKNWESGMGSSIATGMESLTESGLENIIVMLCDQPFIDAGDLRELVSQRERSGCEIVTSRYDGTLGPPALFSKNRFEHLLLLHGKGGAKSLFENEPSLLPIDSAKARIDIDTSSDWKMAIAERAKQHANPVI